MNWTVIAQQIQNEMRQMLKEEQFALKTKTKKPEASKLESGNG